MMVIAITTLLRVITLFCRLVTAKLEFFPQALPEWCSVEGIERQCDGIDGMCAFENEMSLLWCCRSSDPHCNGKAQTCTGVQGDSNQTLCEASGTKWCCDKQYETCGTIADTCTSTFQNPFQSPVKGSTTVPLLDATPSKDSASSELDVPSAPRPTTNPLSTGTTMTPMAIAGIIICAALAVIAIFGALLLGQRRAVAAKDVEYDDGISDEPCSVYEADLEKYLPAVGTPVEVHVRGG